MAFVRVKYHNKRPYYYLVETYRQDGKVRQHIIKYIGTHPPKGPQKGLALTKLRKERNLSNNLRITDLLYQAKHVCIICGCSRTTQSSHIIPQGEDTMWLCPNHHWLYDHHGLTTAEVATLPLPAQAYYKKYL